LSAVTDKDIEELSSVARALEEMNVRWAARIVRRIVWKLLSSAEWNAEPMAEEREA
jgi:hypothetical protein